MEKTVVLLKPDCIMQKHVGEVISRFERAGFSILAMKMMRLSSDILREHYAHLVEKPFYPEIESFMQSSPVIAMVIAGPNAVEAVRQMLGPTDSQKAPKGTIRGDLGQNVQMNVVHASDSQESAEQELKRFFKKEEIFN